MAVPEDAQGGQESLCRVLAAGGSRCEMILATTHEKRKTPCRFPDLLARSGDDATTVLTQHDLQFPLRFRPPALFPSKARLDFIDNLSPCLRQVFRSHGRPDILPLVPHHVAVRLSPGVRTSPRFRFLSERWRIFQDGPSVEGVEEGNGLALEGVGILHFCRFTSWRGTRWRVGV